MQSNPKERLRPTDLDFKHEIERRRRREDRVTKLAAILFLGLFAYAVGSILAVWLA